MPINSSQARCSIASSNILLKELMPIYIHLNKAINTTFVQKSGDYDPIDFKELNLVGDIKFNNIAYEKLINSNFHSKLSIKENKITIDQIESQINGTDIKYHGELKTNHKNGYPFIFNTNFSNLDMTPFIKTFIPGEYTKVGGTVNSFNLSLQGKGFSKKNIHDNLKGKLDINLSKLSLPYQINKYDSIKILLAPLVILEQMRAMVPGGFLVKNFEQGIKSTQNIFKNVDNINLKSGIIMLTAQKGLIRLDKVEFLGKKDEPVNYSYFYGTIDYDGNLKIYSKADISNIIMPFYIDGTLKKPTPDFTFFIPKFLFWNILTILNPVNIYDFTLDVLIGLYKTVEGMAVYSWDFIASTCTSLATYTWDFIKSPFTSDPPEKAEKKKENLEQKKTTPKDKPPTKTEEEKKLSAIFPPLDKDVYNKAKSQYWTQYLKSRVAIASCYAVAS